MQTYLPTTDLLFRKMLTAPDSLHILKAFVKDLLGIEFQSLKPRETYHIETYKHFYKKINEQESFTLRSTYWQLLKMAVIQPSSVKFAHILILLNV